MDDPTVQAALMTFLLALLGLLTALVTAVTPKLRAWLDAEATKQSNAGHAAEVNVLRDLANTAVRSVEQWLSGADGAAKRDAAIDWLYWQAHDRGFDVSEKQTAALVEEAVLLLKATGLDLQTVNAKRDRARDPKTGRFLPKRTDPETRDAETVALLAQTRP